MPKTETRLWTCEGVPLLSLTLTLPYGLHPEIDACLSLVKSGATDACEALFPAIQAAFQQNTDPRRNFTVRRAEAVLLCAAKQVGEFICLEMDYSYRGAQSKCIQHYYTFRLSDGVLLPLWFFLSRRDFRTHQKEKHLPKSLSYARARHLPYRLTNTGLEILFRDKWYPLPPPA